MGISDMFSAPVRKWGAIGLGALTLTAGGLKSCSEVENGEAGVVTTFGKIERVVDSGLAFHWPWQDVNKMNLKSHTVDLPLEVYSKDSQLAPSNVVSVTFSLPRNSVEQVYRLYGPSYFDAVLKNPVENIFREEFGKKTADEIIADRISLNKSISDRLVNTFEGRGMKFETLSISIKFNNSFNNAAEQSAIARTEVNTATQQYQRIKKEAESAEAKATGEANANLVKKQKEAEGILAVGKAEVEVMRQKAELLKENTGLVEIIKAERWDGKLPTTSMTGGATPLLNLDLGAKPAANN